MCQTDAIMYQPTKLVEKNFNFSEKLSSFVSLIEKGLAPLKSTTNPFLPSTPYVLVYIYGYQRTHSHPKQHNHHLSQELKLTIYAVYTHIHSLMSASRKIWT